MIRIRRVDPTNEEVRNKLNELDRQCFPLDELCSKEGFWWIAFHGDKPVAFAGLRRTYKHKEVAYLCRAGVLPEYRGRGLQKRLIRARVSYARKAGFEQVITDTVPGNPASSNSLIACGFKTYTPEALWAEDSIYWCKEL